MNKCKKNGNKLTRKVSNSDYVVTKQQLILFVITGTITLLPFLFLLTQALFEGVSIDKIVEITISFFHRSDMLLAIISITASSALVNIFSGKYKVYISTILCWLIIIGTGMYFCGYNENKVNEYRVLGVFLLACICSSFNIFAQTKIR